MQRSSVRPSVCPIDRQQQRSAAGLLLSALTAGGSLGRHRCVLAIAGAGAQQQRRRAAGAAISGKCEQCHVYSCRRTQTCCILRCDMTVVSYRGRRECSARSRYDTSYHM